MKGHNIRVCQNSFQRDMFNTSLRILRGKLNVGVTGLEPSCQRPEAILQLWFQYFHSR